MKQRFDVLDSFRGLCASFVVVHHINILGAFSNIGFFKHSSIFVEFFFILSGFVLTHTYLNRKISFIQYFKSRTFRLYPLHIFMLLCFILLESAKLLASKYINLNYPAFTGASAPSEIIPNALLIHAWTIFTENTSFNYPSWSISIEYYIYFIFFITLLVSGYKKYFIWIVFSATALLLMNYDLVITENALRGIYAFFGGSMLYILYKYISTKRDYIFKSFKLSSVIEIILLLLVFLSVSYFENYYLKTFLFFIAILFYSFESGIVSNILKKYFFKRLGQLSYSIYMVHAFVILVFSTIFIVLQKITGRDLTKVVDGARFFNLDSPMLANSLLFLILIFVYIISTMTYKYIEIPGINLGRKK